MSQSVVGIYPDLLHQQKFFGCKYGNKSDDESRHTIHAKNKIIKTVPINPIPPAAAAPVAAPIPVVPSANPGSPVNHFPSFVV